MGHLWFGIWLCISSFVHLFSGLMPPHKCCDCGAPSQSVVSAPGWCRVTHCHVTHKLFQTLLTCCCGNRIKRLNNQIGQLIKTPRSGGRLGQASVHLHLLRVKGRRSDRKCLSIITKTRLGYTFNPSETD